MFETTEGLAEMALFNGITAEEISKLLICLHARSAVYAKDAFIIEEGDIVYELGVLISGRGRAVKWDASGRIITITLLKKGSEIGAILAASLDHRSPVTVQVLEESTVLFIPFDQVFKRCNKSCLQHDILLRNYIHIVAEKGLTLHERIDCLLKPTVREKIMAYLMRLAREQQSSSFSVPLNRNEMSEYLNVERSALSRELSRMKSDGIIDYHRDNFRFL